MMRLKSPSLVVPGMVIQQHEADQLGITRIKTIGQRQDEVAADKLRGGKPRLIEGSWVDGSASQSIAEALHLDGQVNNQADLGFFETDPQAYEDFVIRNRPTATTASNTSAVTYADAYELTVTFTAGVWSAWVMFDASFTNSTGTINQLRIIDSVYGVLAADTPTTQTTRERYGLYTQISPYDPTMGAITWTFQYRLNAAGPTATARAPWVIGLFERVVY